MKQGYYIYYVRDDLISEGVLRKINMQTDEFCKVLPFEKLNVYQGKVSAARKILQTIPSVKYFDDKKIPEKLNDPAVLYVRKWIIDRGMISFFKRMKKENRGCVIILEMPVFPYFKDDFYHSFKHFLRYFPLWVKDSIYRKKLHECVDYIATFSDVKEICGVPALKIKNGIQVDKIPPLKPREKDETINITSVAVMAVHHGYERLINGINDYYKNGGSRNIKYHVIGYGPEEAYYRSLVKQYGLEDRIIFYGKKTGEELDEIYKITDITAASLGMYKIGLKAGSFIKTGEYLAKGLPMITGCEVDVLDHSDFDYFIEFPNDDSPIDIEKVIEFYDRISAIDRSKVIEEIRAYAYKKADMSVALKAVTDVMKTAVQSLEE